MMWGSALNLQNNRKHLRLKIIFKAAFVAALMAIGKAHADDAPPPAVEVAPVVVADVAPSSSNVGHVIAIQSVTIVPRVTAFIDEVNVKQGSTVRAGQLLFSLQTAQYEAALQTAQANLASAQAAVQNAELVYARAAKLNTTGFETQTNLDQALATRNSDRANVLAAQASVATAQLNLSYCKIAAPIDGRIGAVTKTKGNLVTAASGTLATINQLDPIRVVFSVDSASPILVSTQQTAGTKAPAASNLAVGLTLPSGQKYPYKGKIAFFDNQVDTQTGTVNVYADFSNPQNILLPGAYVSVDTSPAKPQQAPLVPVAAVQTDQGGDFVLVVGSDNKVEQRAVTLGEQIAQNFIVKKGLTRGDKVIVDGAQKVKVGQTVNPTVDVASHPSTDAASASESN